MYRCFAFIIRESVQAANYSKYMYHIIMYIVHVSRPLKPGMLVITIFIARLMGYQSSEFVNKVHIALHKYYSQQSMQCR